MSSLKLLLAIGGIDDRYLEEAEVTDVALEIASIKRKRRYQRVAATSAFIAVIYWIVRQRKGSKGSGFRFKSLATR